MKRSEIRALADETYSILDEYEGEAAVERALTVLANAPDDPESYLLMAEVAEESERFENAIMWTERGLAHFPNHPGLLLKKATILIDVFEEVDEAFAILSSIENGFNHKDLVSLKREFGTPLIAEVHLLLADCYRLKNDFKQALIHANTAVSIAPADENAVLGMATALFEMGEYDAALDKIEPVETKSDISDFYWQKGLILCAQGKFNDADANFLEAYRVDKSRYHKPVRLDQESFVSAFEQAILALPREIRGFINQTSVTISDIVPIDLVKEGHGSISPQACISIDIKVENHEPPLISLYQKNVENLATRRSEIKDIIASALLHDLGQLVANI